MNCNFDIVNPVTCGNWNEILLASAGASFFHTSNWAAVLQQSYDYRPLYFVQIEAGKLKALMPLMEVSSWLTGKRAVSLPFTDYCEPIAADEAAAQALRAAALRYAKTAKWKYVELRGGRNPSGDAAASATFYRHVIDLSPGHSSLFAALRDSTKRNIKKAANKGLTVERSRSAAAMTEFYRLHCQTRQGHGVPPQPFHFFERIHQHVISQGMGDIIAAKYEGQTIAAAVYFHFGREVIYKYGASDKSHQWLRPNNLVMWEAIKWYSQNDYSTLCMGRTELHHAGLRQFKVGWGAEESLMQYSKYDLARNSFVQDAPKTDAPYHQVMTRMPIAVLRLAGSLLYKHMG